MSRLTSYKVPTYVAFAGTLSSRGISHINLGGADFGSSTGKSHPGVYNTSTTYNTSSLGYAWRLHLRGKGRISNCRVRSAKATSQSSSPWQPAFRTRCISISLGLAPVIVVQAARRYCLAQIPTYLYRHVDDSASAHHPYFHPMHS